MVKFMKQKNLLLGAIFLLFSFCSCTTAVIEEVIITEAITYNANVSIIITNNCLPCHAGGFPSAGLNLEGYTNVRASTENGNLFSIINNVSNPMPQSCLMAPDLIATIEQWPEDCFI